MSNKKLTEQINIHMDKDLKEQIESYCSARCLEKSEFIRRAILAAMQKEKAVSAN